VRCGLVFTAKTNAQVARFLFNLRKQGRRGDSASLCRAPLARADEVIKGGNIDKAHVIAAATRPEVVSSLGSGKASRTRRIGYASISIDLPTRYAWP